MFFYDSDSTHEDDIDCEKFKFEKWRRKMFPQVQTNETNGLNHVCHPNWGKEILK